MHISYIRREAFAFACSRMAHILRTHGPPTRCLTNAGAIRARTAASMAALQQRRFKEQITHGDSMSFIIVLAALAFLMLAAYRGYSVILFAPIAALGAVLFTDPSAVAPVFTGHVHGEDGRLRQAVFPGVPARRGVRQADRAVGLLRAPSSPRPFAVSARRARQCGDRRGLRLADLWRRVAVRRGVRGLSVRGRDCSARATFPSA